MLVVESTATGGHQEFARRERFPSFRIDVSRKPSSSTWDPYVDRHAEPSGGTKGSSNQNVERQFLRTKPSPPD